MGRALSFQRVCAAFVLLLAVFALGPSTATAQFEPSGALTLSGAFADEVVGGGLILDVHAPIDVFRVGAAVGVAGFSSDNDQRSRIFAPIALSLGAVLMSDSAVGLDVRARAGFWAGATNEGIHAGPWISAGAFILFQLSAQVALGAGVEGWFAFGEGDLAAVSPGMTLVWAPLPDE